MAEITRGKWKGTQVNVRQVCNDWMLVEGLPVSKMVQSPVSMKLTYEEWDRFKMKNLGMFFDWFHVNMQDGFVTFKKKR